MLNVYIADLTGLEESYEEKVKMLHQSRADKLKAYKIPADRVRGLGAGLLLENGLEDYLNQQIVQTAMQENAEINSAAETTAHIPKDEAGRYNIRYGYGPQGKPYFKDYPNIYFSLSHSGKLAVLALSDGEVGIDVQEHRGYNEKIVKRFFHEEERKILEAVAGSEEKEILFYKIWTSKEAYIKFTGKGMGEELAKFYCQGTENKIYDKAKNSVNCVSVPLEENGYQCSIVSAHNSTKIDKIIKIVL